ncbi:MAG: hypothetical protein AAGJ80_10835, partial [Cyanobacteria bacterium J06553_1]
AFLQRLLPNCCTGTGFRFRRDLYLLCDMTPKPLYERILASYQVLSSCNLARVFAEKLLFWVRDGQ